jgi:hypothetical protein
MERGIRKAEHAHLVSAFDVRRSSTSEGIGHELWYIEPMGSLNGIRPVEHRFCRLSHKESAGGKGSGTCQSLLRDISAFVQSALGHRPCVSIVFGPVIISRETGFRIRLRA